MTIQIAILGVALSVCAGCTDFFTKTHGEAGVNASVDAQGNAAIVAEGKVTWRKRVLTQTEKGEIHQTAIDTGRLFAQGKRGTDEQHEKALLAQRLGYHFRVYPSIIRPLSDQGFDEGKAQSSVEARP